jgi:hypothetical protein
MSVGLQFHFCADGAMPGAGFLQVWRRTRAERPELSWSGAAVAALSKMLIRFKHVEISLPPEIVRGRACAHACYQDCPPGARLCISAISRSGTIMQFKMLSNESYEHTLELRVSEAQALDILAFADAHTGVPFAHDWHQSFFFPMPSDGRTFFCVQYVVMCVQAAGLLEGLNPSAATGDALLWILREHYGAKHEMRPAAYFDERSL